MAKAKRKRIKQAVSRRLHQEPIVRRIAEILASGKPTKFRWSSACHQGLRTALCLKGKSWAAADERATLIVRFALARIGAQYPTLRVASGETQAEIREYFYCASCRGHMPEGSGRPWCSEECRKAINEDVRCSTRQREDTARAAAVRSILVGPAEPVANPQRHCRRCSKLFTPLKVGIRYCSKACSAMREKYPSRPCLVCASSFKPWVHLQLTCGPACSKAVRSQRERAKKGIAPLPLVKACVICSAPFAPARVTSAQCSDECRHEAHLRATRAYTERQRGREKQRRARERAREGVTAEAA